MGQLEEAGQAPNSPGKAVQESGIRATLTNDSSNMQQLRAEMQEMEHSDSSQVKNAINSSIPAPDHQDELQLSPTGDE